LAAAASLASYNSGKVGIDGFSIAQTFTTANGGTNATLFTANAGTPTGSNWVLGFEGTASLSDWAANAANGVGTSGRYSAAVSIANLAALAYGADVGLLAGHSLGGGEAALASYVSGVPAITFNAAGVDPSRYNYSGSASQITNYVVAGEPLSTAQSILPIPGALGQQVIMSPVTSPGFGNWFNHGMNAVVPALCNNLGNCGP
jgi:hypothetical protein